MIRCAVSPRQVARDKARLFSDPPTPHPDSTELTEVRPLSRKGRGENTRRITFVRCSRVLHRDIVGRPPAARRGLRRASRNRRKWCALNLGNAHNGALGVRVGALTNKAAHYRFHLVRTGQRALRGLTSMASRAAGKICRERRAVVLGENGDVRIGAHIRNATQRVPYKRCAMRRSKMSVRRTKMPEFCGLRARNGAHSNPAYVAGVPET